MPVYARHYNGYFLVYHLFQNYYIKANLVEKWEDLAFFVYTINITAKTQQQITMRVGEDLIEDVGRGFARLASVKI